MLRKIIKLRPVVIYHAENHRGLTGLPRISCHLYWWSVENGRPSGPILTERFNDHLHHELKPPKIWTYKIILMLDNATGQPLVTEISTHKII
jgi:hypothetical protein